MSRANSFFIAELLHRIPNGSQTRQETRERATIVRPQNEVNELENAAFPTLSLPRPVARVALAAIEGSGRFGRRWKAWSRRLGLFDTSNITVLADGAKWIWEEQRKLLTEADGVLDIFHALEHFASAARSVYGDGTDEAAAWLESSRTVALAGAWPAIEQHITTARNTWPDSPAKQQS